MAKYMVTYSVSGTMTLQIETDETMEQIEARLDREVNEEDWEVDLDTIDDVDFSVQRMTLVERATDGSRVWTTYIRATDKVIEQ